MAIKIPPGARASFIAAAISMVVGISGTSRSITALFAPPQAMTRETGEHESVAMSQALDELSNVMIEEQHTPMQRAIIGANAIVSALLFVAGFHLWRRRRNAVWWMTQASLANLVYTTADVAIDIFRMHHSPRLVRALSNWIQVTMAANSSHDTTQVPILSRVDVVTFATFALIIGGVLRSLVHVWIFWRIRRDDVRAFIATPRPSVPPSM